MLDWLADPQAWAALATLTVLEIVLGIDNIIFISILTGKLPPERQPSARTYGLALAMVTRILLLFSISWVMSLEAELFALFGHGFSGRDLILLLGGAFLVWKATHEIHSKLEGEEHAAGPAGKAVSYTGVLVQIALLDIVFSLDSVITAVGMADHLSVMVLAVVIAIGVMMVFATPIATFVHEHPTVKMLALAFLILIGVTLAADGLGQHISKGYIYSAMAFSLFVEFLNIRAGKNKGGPPPVPVHVATAPA